MPISAAAAAIPPLEIRGFDGYHDDDTDREEMTTTTGQAL